MESVRNVMIAEGTDITLERTPDKGRETGQDTSKENGKICIQKWRRLGIQGNENARAVKGATAKQNERVNMEKPENPPHGVEGNTMRTNAHKDTNRKQINC